MWEIFEKVLFLFDSWLFELYEYKTCSKISPNTVGFSFSGMKSAVIKVNRNIHISDLGLYLANKFCTVGTKICKVGTITPWEQRHKIQCQMLGKQHYSMGFWPPTNIWTSSLVEWSGLDQNYPPTCTCTCRMFRGHIDVLDSRCLIHV